MPRAAKTATTTKNRPRPPSATKLREDRAETRSELSPGYSNNAPVHAHTDPAQWRASKVWHRATITKGNAMAQYRLKTEDFRGLPFQKKLTTVAGKPAEMHLYLERDVERRAWERHGGPEGFETYLKKLYERHLNSNRAHRAFTQPAQYSFGRKSAATSSVPIRTMHRSDATLERIKAGMQPWLWKAFNEALDRHNAYNYELCYLPYETSREREGPFLLAEKFARTYPPRPEQPLPSSPSVDAVRALLAEAASPPESYSPEWGCRLDGLEFHRNCFPEEEEWYDWSAEYREKLFSALIRVIEEHGLGDEGWRGIRWEVYDKYAQTLGKSIECDEREKKWTDEAAHWLDGRFTTEGIVLDFTGRRCCPAGQRYNSMLPLLHPQGSMYVGWAR